MADEYCMKCKSRLTTCPTCKGKGTVLKDLGLVPGTGERPCKNCDGTGKLCPKHGSDWR